MTDEDFLVQLQKDILKANKTIDRYLKKMDPDENIKYYDLIMDIHKSKVSIIEELNKINLRV